MFKECWSCNLYEVEIGNAESVQFANCKQLIDNLNTCIRGLLSMSQWMCVKLKKNNFNSRALCNRLCVTCCPIGILFGGKKVNNLVIIN